MIQSKSKVNLKNVNLYLPKLLSFVIIFVFIIHIVSLPIVLNKNEFFSNNGELEKNSQIKETIKNTSEQIDKIKTANTDTIANGEKNYYSHETKSSTQSTESEKEISKNNPLFSQIPTYSESNPTSQIKANESFILSNDGLSLNTTGSFNNPSLKDTTSINFPSSGYTNTSQSFTVDNITASYNYSHIEYEDFGSSSIFTSKYVGGLGIQSVSTSFNVTEEIVNLTTVRLTYVRSGSPNGVAYISGDNSGEPNNTILGGQTITLEDYTGQNITASFSNPITLTKGTYHIVLNDTSTGSEFDFFQYYYVMDSTDGDDESSMNRVGWAGGGWTTTTGDLYFSYEYIQLNDTDSSQLKEYITNPEEVGLTYNGTSITTFSGNNLLLDGDIAEFTSNTSVTFDLQYIINYDSNLNGINNLLTYLNVNNGSLPIWNNSFVNNEISAGSYSISQRNLTIYDISSDWNNTAIYRNESDYLGSYSYSNGSDKLILHLDQLTNPYSWILQFTSPNYLNSLDIQQNGNSIFAPYQVNSSDTLSVIANLSTTAYTGKNASLMIYDFNSKLNYTEIDVDVTNKVITFSDWIISNNLSLSIFVNGSYQLIIRWLSDDGTQVGYIGIDLEIITQTTLLSPGTIPKTIIHENISIEFNFLSDQNISTIDDADLSYTTSWGESDSLIQSGLGSNYTVDINTSLATEGIGSVTVSALLFGHVNRSVSLNVLLSRNTSLLANANFTTIFYKDVIEIIINYENDTSQHIPTGGIQVNGTAVNVTEQASQYVFLINSSVVDPTLTSFSYVITTNKLYFENRSDTIVFTMLANPTILNEDFAPLNDKITQAFSGGPGDSFTFSLQYNDTIHTTVIPNAALTNNGSSIANITAVEDPTNHSWIITVDPTEANINQTITFTFSEEGYQPSYYFLTLDISIAVFNLTYSINSIQNVRFGDNHTFRLDITDNSSAFISGVTLTPNSTTFVINSLLNGSYDIIYIGATQAYSGNFTFLVQITKTGFVSNSMLLNYSIIQPLSEFITQVTPMNGSSILSEWGDDTFLNISFIDHTNNIPLQSIIELTNVSDLTVELVSSNNSFHIFRINPQKTGYWVLNLTLDPNLPGYFFAGSTFITINATERTTATEFIFINAPNGRASPEYDRDIVIGIIWNDTEKDTIKAQGDFLADEIIWNPGGPIWVQFLNYADGVHYFRVYGLSISQFSIQILFNSSEFKAINTTLTVNVQLLSTNELMVDTTSGLIGSSINQSKFGYTLHLTFNWTISDNGSTIYNPDIELKYNGTIITPDLFDKYGLFVVTNSTDFSAHIFITFYATQNGLSGYNISWHQFTFSFSYDNYVSKEHVLNIFTEGYDLDVTVIYDSRLIPGSTYSITVQVVYSNISFLKVTNSSSNLRLQFVPTDTLVGFPIIENIPVNYEIEVLLKSNNSIVTLRATRTIVDGESIYIIPADITDDILEIRGISITIEGATNNAEQQFDITIGDLPIVEEIPGFPFDILAIAMIITAIVITTFLFIYNKRRTRKQKKGMVKKQKLADIKERIALISNIYTILVTSESGLPVYSIINALYKNNPAISEIVSGLSVGIDSFLQSFQTDFMQQLGEEITHQKQVKVSIIQREEFQIMILGTLSYRIFVFLRDKPPQFVIDIFSNIIGDLEISVKLDDLIDEKIIRPKAEYVLRKFFPLTLLSTFVIDPNRLKFVEVEIKKKRGPKISQEALLALKQLALIRSGLMTNFRTSPQERGKMFDKFLKTGELGEIGIIHYDVAYNMLERTLELPIEIVLEALWTGSNAEVSILIPFHEELLPRRK